MFLSSSLCFLFSNGSSNRLAPILDTDPTVHSPAQLLPWWDDPAHSQPSGHGPHTRERGQGRDSKP